MITVEPLDIGVFRVSITAGSLGELIEHCILTDVEPDDLIRGTLLSMLGFINRSLESERS